MQEVKKCEKCLNKKAFDQFFKSKGGAFGLHGYCKPCHYAYKKAKYVPTPITKLTEEQKSERLKQSYLKNREKRLLKAKIRYNKLKKEAPEKLKKYRSNSKKTDNEHRKLRYKSDPVFKLKMNLRRRMCKLISRKDRKGSAVRDLGCDFDFFINYIQSKFQVGMTWENYGKWHLDHIYPLSKVDLTNREEFLKVAHYTNYQPLWAKDNISKSDKLPEERKVA